MQYYRCKCGEAESYGSMPPKKCRGCSKCNTTLAQHPDDHEAPIPHDFVTETTTIRDSAGNETSKSVKYCRVCLNRAP